MPITKEEIYAKVSANQYDRSAFPHLNYVDGSIAGINAFKADLEEAFDMKEEALSTRIFNMAYTYGDEEKTMFDAIEKYEELAELVHYKGE